MTNASWSQRSLLLMAPLAAAALGLLAACAREDCALARQLAAEAEADATLAEANSRSVRSERALNEVREGIRMLRQEMARQ